MPCPFILDTILSIRKIRWRRDRLLTPVFLGFPGGSAGRESACNVGDLGLIPWLGRPPGEGNSYPLQYSGLEMFMDCSQWGCKESDTTEQLSLSFYILNCVLNQYGLEDIYFFVNTTYLFCCLNCSSFDPYAFFQVEYSSFDHCEFLSF